MAKAKTQTPAKRESKSEYTEKAAQFICERIANGDSLVTICKSEEMPHIVTVYRWLAENEGFRNMYVRAREDQADTMADEIVQIADTEEDSAKARVRIDARKWVASKLKPRKYGDKLDIEHSGSVELDATKVLGELGGLLESAMKMAESA